MFYSQIPPDIISEHEEILIRFHSDDSMGFKGFALSFAAVDPLEDGQTEEGEEEESGEIQPTHFPGYYGPGSFDNNQKKTNHEDTDDYEEPEETNYKKPDEDLDEDLVTDNEENLIFNSNRINEKNTKIAESSKKKDDPIEESDDDDD